MSDREEDIEVSHQEPRKRRKVNENANWCLQEPDSLENALFDPQSVPSDNSQSQELTPLHQLMNAIISTEEDPDFSNRVGSQLWEKSKKSELYSTCKFGPKVKKEVAESDSSDSEDSDYLEDNLKPIKQEPVVPKICLLKSEKNGRSNKKKLTRTLQINYRITEDTENEQESDQKTEMIINENNLHLKDSFLKQLKDLNKSLKRMQAMFMMEMLNNKK